VAKLRRDLKLPAWAGAGPDAVARAAASGPTSRNSLSRLPGDCV